MAKVLFVCNEGLTSHAHANRFNEYLLDGRGERGKHRVDAMSLWPVARFPGVKDFELGKIAEYDHVVSSWPHLTSLLRDAFEGSVGAPRIHDFSRFARENPRDWRAALYDYLERVGPSHA